MIHRLVYYIKSASTFTPFYEYSSDSIHADEIYARQLCEYFIKDGKEFELYSNELSGDDEILVIEERGEATKFSDEQTYSTGIHLEIRQYKRIGEMSLLYTFHLDSHWEAMRFLLKDIIEVPKLGSLERDSAEIDEDRGCYVIYVQ
ncbi:RNA helicase [Bacillus salitolerans]|uniref:RNA helicase n=1 Tax=Bacillus salitolerans TaxID=1437434 RepID=A0ABW4LUD7_9BACI